MWRNTLSSQLQIPLINADRMMMSILPEPGADRHLVDWARVLRDEDEGWQRVAQQGVQAFVGHAMSAKVPFAMETVFSHWKERPDGTIESKVEQIQQMQAAGYFVLLVFVGLASADLSVFRVQTRMAEGGHAVPEEKLRERFPRTQRAIREALTVADAAILTDNSRAPEQAFTVCRVESAQAQVYDVREGVGGSPAVVDRWLSVICPR